jgi:predicted ABC-type ATPase
MPKLFRALRVALGLERPVLVFLAGPNGAGKSTFFQVYIRALGLPFANADEVAAGIRATGLASEDLAVDQLAFHKTEDLRRSLLDSRASFCTETVFSDEKGAKLAYLREARDRGYTVFLVFIGIDSPALSIARVSQRVAQGGHDVPDDKLSARFPRTMNNLQQAVSIAHHAFLFDNSSAQAPFRLIARYSDGALTERHDPIPPWATELPGIHTAS